MSRDVPKKMPEWQHTLFQNLHVYLSFYVLSYQWHGHERITIHGASITDASFWTLCSQQSECSLSPKLITSRTLKNIYLKCVLVRPNNTFSFPVCSLQMSSDPQRSVACLDVGLHFVTVSWWWFLKVFLSTSPQSLWNVITDIIYCRWWIPSFWIPCHIFSQQLTSSFWSM